MAQNFLFMFEFVVDEVIVTKPNRCAPEEYPACCEMTFRNSVFVSICDRESNQCVDPCKPKCGKSCLFSLETPVTEADKLFIHIYKKKTEQCKFLIGCTDLQIKGLFDKVMENFNIENPNFQDTLAKHAKNLSKPKDPKKATEIVDNDCDSNEEGRREQLCPASELTKQLLPIFNLKGLQTGNVVLLIRLVAIGPTIVSTFPFSRICEAGCEKKPLNCNLKSLALSKKSCDDNDTCNSKRFEGGMDNTCPGNCGNNPSGSKQYKNNSGCMPLRDPCYKEVKKPICQRYFACNADKGLPCDVVEDECERAAKCRENKKNCCPASEQSNTSFCEECMDECEAADYNCCPDPDPFKCEHCSAEKCDDCVKDPCAPCGQCMQPCFQTPRQPDPGPDAYDEFEACLNGSGLVIRVLKDTHQVESICDGTEEFINDDNICDSNKLSGQENIHNSDCSLSNMLKRNNFARNHIKRRTGGRIINHPDLPKIRANIKYSGNDECYMENYNIPYSKIKTYCDNQINKIDDYRSHRARMTNRNENFVNSEPKHRKDEQNCCIQVDREDIRNVMKGLDVDTRKKGIEVCYKTCEETDSDVFLVKLGSKQKSERKKNNIEIELKTPKLPVTIAKQHVTTETQINETDLDAALADICKGKKGKGGKGKKKKK